MTGIPKWRAMFGFAALAVIGLAIVRRDIQAEAPAGALLLLTGGLGLGWEARRAWLNDRIRRAHTAARERRAAISAARRAREQLARHQRSLRRRTDEGARERHAVIARAEHFRNLGARRQEILRRSMREQELSGAARRWHALDAGAFAAELESVFSRRGLMPMRGDTGDLRDVILTTAAGARSVARHMPPGLQARARDVQELDDIRRRVGAETAYLVALAGFTSAAVRLSRTLPLTLVEAHLLAAWQQQDVRT